MNNNYENSEQKSRFTNIELYIGIVDGVERALDTHYLSTSSYSILRYQSTSCLRYLVFARAPVLYSRPWRALGNDYSVIIYARSW